MSKVAICFVILAVFASAAVAAPGGYNNNNQIVISIPSSVAAAVPTGRAYQRAVRVGKILNLTPVRGVYLQNNTLVSGGINAQAAKAVANVKALLGVAGCDLSNVYQLSVRLININDLDAVNNALNVAFDAANTDIQYAGAVEVHSALIGNARVEIGASAANCDF